MKVYTRIIFDWDGNVIEEDSIIHDGNVSLCKGSSSSTTVDKEYNKRLAVIQERQQDIADKYFSYWEEYQKPYEMQQIAANTELLPRETEYSKASLDDKIQTLGMMQPVKTNFFQQAAEGKDVHGQMAMAQADVAKGFEDTQAATSRAMGRAGVNPSSGRYAGVSASTDLAKAAAVAGARTQARTATEDENFKRLSVGMQFGMQGG
jgi:hypothetical protein